MTSEVEDLRRERDELRAKLAITEDALARAVGDPGAKINATEDDDDG